LAELHRNDGLRSRVGIEHEHDLRNDWNLSHFRDFLVQRPYWTMFRTVFDGLVKWLGVTAPNLDRQTVRQGFTEQLSPERLVSRPAIRPGAWRMMP
jgi:hypothetical protein